MLFIFRIRIELKCFKKLNNQCLSYATFKITTQDNTLLGVRSTYIDVLKDCKKNNFLKSVEH